MNAVTMPRKRKVIDIPQDTFRYLSIKAAAQGTNLKKYIEALLAKDVEDMDDVATYEHLVKTDPDGLVPLSEEENAEALKWLGIVQR